MSGARGGVDIEAAFAVAVLVLGLSPREAWAASLREIALAARLLGGAEQAPRRADLDRLMERFPDRYGSPPNPFRQALAVSGGLGRSF